MQVNLQHRLDEAAWQPSPHWDPRPIWAQPELIVIHCVSLPEGQFGTGHPQALFEGCLDCQADDSFADLEGLHVAPHVFIDREGRATQFVEFDKGAWHAGVSRWRGRDGCNNFAIGIELEGAVNAPYTLAQYDTLTEVLSALIAQYDSLSVDAIVGHNEIAPGRKQDPGPFFDWCGLLCQLHRQMV